MLALAVGARVAGAAVAVVAAGAAGGRRARNDDVESDRVARAEQLAQLGHCNGCGSEEGGRSQRGRMEATASAPKKRSTIVSMRGPRRSVWPPSIAKHCPVTHDDSGPASQRTAAAMSSVVPRRAIGIWSR